jgi:hypothetical protein
MIDIIKVFWYGGANVPILILIGLIVTLLIILSFTRKIK